MTDTLERTTARERKPQRRRGSRLASMMFVVLLVSLGLVASGVLPIQQYLERENQVVGAQERLDALRDENLRLEEDAAALLTDQEIERIAREQYGYVRPGETGYVVIPPDGVDLVAEAPVVEPVVEPRSWWQRIWDFVSGRDVATDG